MNNENGISWVISFNENYPIPLRHIVEIHDEYDHDEFVKWYYEEYHKLYGDHFIHCKTKEQRDLIVKKIQNGEKIDE